jgi:hypothetical protein
MSDRTSAEIFGQLFETLASADGPLDRKEFAGWVWNCARGYDFHPCQMGADDALIKLGLATHAGAAEDEEVVYHEGPVGVAK